ncbi:MAG: hypothetical protein MUF19_03770 [Candidatus Pacebacteria bacterium]|jgi:hypothetical protein|nr:hypothetical protein [Candidatus Paceibacterota bacterium]
MFLKCVLLLFCSLTAQQVAAENVSLNPPKVINDVVRCSERSYAEDIVNAFRISNATGQVKLEEYTNYRNPYGLQGCNEVTNFPLLIGQVDMGTHLETIGRNMTLVIVEVRLGLHPEDVDDVGFIIMTAEQYEALLADLL